MCWKILIWSRLRVVSKFGEGKSWASKTHGWNLETCDMRGAPKIRDYRLSQQLSTLSPAFKPLSFQSVSDHWATIYWSSHFTGFHFRFFYQQLRSAWFQGGRICGRGTCHVFKSLTYKPQFTEKICKVKFLHFIPCYYLVEKQHKQAHFIVFHLWQHLP